MAKPTLVLLVRHGTTPTTGKILPGRARGLHLAESGKEQARRAAERIAELGAIAAIYSSPLERARETAAMKKPEWATVQRAPSMFRFPDGESFVEMQTRMAGAIDRIRRRHAGKTVVCVSHADPIKALVAHATGTPLDLFQRIVISTCSVTAIMYTDTSPIVLTVNSTGASLKDLRPS